MLFVLLFFLLLGAALGINILGGLFRIFLFFLVISLLWFIIKAGFYILFSFAVFYLGIKGFIYISGLLSKVIDGKFHKKYNRVPYGDAEIIEMLE